MVTFTRHTYDATASPPTDTVTTITGNAVQVKGNPQTYAALSLVPGAAPTLLFTPTSYNLRPNSTAFVQVGDTVSWAGQTYYARSVDVVAPDGYVILSRIVVSA